MTLRQATAHEHFQWLRFRGDPGDPNLTIGYTCELRGPADTGRLDAALREVVVTAFPRLLDYFTEVRGSLQVRTRPAPRSVLRHCATAAELHDAPPLDPAGQQLYRFLCRRESSELVLLRLDFSHLVFDGGGFAPFFAALAACWRGAHPEPESPAWQPKTPDHAAATAFWRDALDGAPLHQPLGFARTATPPAARPLSVRHTVGDAQGVHRLLRERDATLLQLVVALTGALLHTRTGDADHPVVVAHTVDTRRRGTPHGCHTTLLPIWLAPAPASRTARSLLDEVGVQREKMRPHQHFPVLDLLALAAAEPDRPRRSAGPLLNVVVNSSPATLPTAPPELTGLNVRWLRTPETASSSDLTITFASGETGIRLSFDSSSRLVTADALAAFAADFLTLLRFAVAHPERPLAACDLSRPTGPVAEGAPGGGGHRALGRMIADTAGVHPDRIAVADDHRTLTYRELLAEASALAAAVDAAPGAIGVLVTRSAAVPVCYLAALLLGRPFVPLDPVSPDERLTRCGEAAEVRVVLADPATRERAARLFPHARVHDVTTTGPGPAVVPEPGVDPDRVAYVLFTSGSTGIPKGVMVGEGNLVNFLLSVGDDPGLRPEDRVLALTPVSFDISLLELLLPLVHGAAVEILPDEARLSGSALAERLDRGRITVVQATPSTWRVLEAAGWRARTPMTLLCGGEHLEPEVAEYLLAQGSAVYTMYGPTEATIWSSWHRVTHPRDVHLGTPVRGTAYHVVDDEGRAVAPGAPGELVIAGDCVAKGYLNAADTPFRPLQDGTPAYRTGDLVRHEGEGRVVFAGRKDGQRKVNGYRVEPGEVAAVVRQVVPTATVFVVVAADPEPHLRCLVWLPEGRDFDAGAVRDRCQAALPHYLRPKTIDRLRSIPLTPNGKADTRALAERPRAELDLAQPQAPAEASRPGDDGLVAELRRLVADELHVPPPDADQPLGYQGIGSLGYNVLAVRISERYGVPFQAHDFYRLTTLLAVAAAVSGTAAGPEPAGKRGRRTTSGPAAADDRLAIVGLAAVLPGGGDAGSFWEALLAGVDAVGPADPDRGLPGEVAGFLPGVKSFDARFFSISPLEAGWMDPRQRVLLQSTWHALEDACRAPAELRGTRTGCYVAATGADYAVLQARAAARQAPHSLVGASASLLANRLSAFFDWTGPSATLDTACSGSLVALVRACRDLRTGACDTAVVGGVNLILDQQVNDGLHAAGLLSPRHRCATFDASADGYVRGEGYGTLVVRRLPDALAEGNRVLAVIESAVENHGGRANSLTAPNPNAQRSLLLEAYTPELAARTGYIETHGSGTALGDAIEFDALARAWAELVPEPELPVRLGAVKTNVGHLEAAAGIASVVKVVKAFEHRTLPGNLHFSELNPRISLAGTPFELLEKPVSWTGPEPLVAGISSFGFGGSNAHVVLSAPPPDPAREPEDGGTYLMPLSARTPRALQALAGALRAELPRLRLGELSHTLCRGREHFEHRQAWVVSSAAQLADALGAVAEPVRVGPAGDPVVTADPEQARRAYLAGHPVDWPSLFAGRPPRFVRLPAYPFADTDFWFTR
ncbi:AMP-binding protein [Amycolatopsis sp. Hca4]|uniref:AMP-binding protein n=1 Tax=Amycolatopsis sp. Hca4 TaxID=2742131 RepID=UPI00158FC2CE|nr:AMP-binding protein [Amycolatopsis sp. Hca4]QKV80355.1 AMP-binding protein [Amycolatopsis sp. Hca4]